MKKKIILKKPAKIILGVLASIFIIVIGVFIFFIYNKSQLMKLSYSSKASSNIIKNFKKSYIVSVGENKTLNAAFESEYYKEKYLDNYQKIKYQNQENLIKNINILIEKDYDDYEISMIVSHGDDKAVTDFTKRGKIRYLEEFFSIDFAKLENYDRYVKYMDEEREDEETTVLHVNLNLDKEDYTEAKEVDKFSKSMFVNKHKFLGKDFKVKNLVNIDNKYKVNDSYELKVNREAYQAFIKMYKDAEKEGLKILVNSSYRSYEDQEETWNEYHKLYGEKYVMRYVSKPGFSEHQTGLALDLASPTSNLFVNSNEAKWLFKNAYKYGFINRYPKGLESITGFESEAWHYRYVGKEIAKEIDDNNMTFDEYYVRYLDKSN